MLDFQKNWCLNILDDLTSSKRQEIFKLFDAGQSVSGRVKTPINIGIVRNKLSSGEYKSVPDWAKDVNLIFFNAKSCNKKGSPTYIVADYLEKWFAKKTVVFPETKEDEWIMRFQKLQTKIQELVDMKVKFG